VGVMSLFGRDGGLEKASRERARGYVKTGTSEVGKALQDGTKRGRELLEN